MVGNNGCATGRASEPSTLFRYQVFDPLFFPPSTLIKWRGLRGLDRLGAAPPPSDVSVPEEGRPVAVAVRGDLTGVGVGQKSTTRFQSVSFYIEYVRFSIAFHTFLRLCDGASNGYDVVFSLQANEVDFDRSPGVLGSS